MYLETIQTKFAICVNHSHCDDLTIMRIYPTWRDRSAEKDNYLRIVDDSGEDYLYPESYFILVEFPQIVEEQLLALDRKNNS